jgi:hypothetical protein
VASIVAPRSALVCPDGVPPVVAMTAAPKAEQPRRTPSQTEWLFREVDEMVFHSLQGTDEP